MNEGLLGRDRRSPGEWGTSSYALSSVALTEPSTYKQPVSGDCSVRCSLAIQSEMTSILKNKTWSLVPGSNTTNVLTIKMIYKIKNIAVPSGGNDYLYKPVLVARGYQQIKGPDIEKIFAHVISF